ncbi:MFS transporter [Fodinicola feengrottensis]|uniref:MFS transporter n=1 Tax=Fodinicola feengrottensis TaxID=435914 RepID=UPI0024425DB8|nr:MFS transporter [Fodinicola feengrottensis]
MSVTTNGFTEVKDQNGRVYRMGETPHDIMGRPRWLMVLLPWIGMLGISVWRIRFRGGRGNSARSTRLVFGPHLLAAGRLGVLPGRGAADDVAVLVDDLRNQHFRHRLPGAVWQGNGLRGRHRGYCAALKSIVNGTGRGVIGWISDKYGRRQTLVLVCIVLGLAQFGVLATGLMQNLALFLLCSMISGFGGGAIFPLFAAMTADYFGENNNASNYGMV